MSKNSYFKQPSVMNSQQHFSQVPSADINRSSFDRSHAYKTTFDAGQLIPVYVDEVLPGDTFNMNATSFARLATPLKPIMDNLKLDIHFFFVPTRLVWEDFQKFMGERPTPDFDPDTLSVPTIPYIRDGAADFANLAQYFGLPINQLGTTVPATEISVLPFRAYNLIWNEWYRDQNLQQPAPFSIDSGVDLLADYKVLPRGKRHDYFTSCLPWPQKGDPVTIPLGTEAELDITGGSVTVPNHSHSLPVTGVYSIGSEPPGASGRLLTGTGTGASGAGTYPVTGLVGTADLSGATAISINDLREAFQVQKMLERDARGGTRYIEIILSHFGVQSDDARLQRPEFLGGGTANININPIANTAGDAAPQGNLAAFGTSVGNGRFKKSFTEHGFIIGLVSARADLTYQQGIERFWSRRTRYDFYWPTLAHLGEQAVLNKELWWSNAAVDDKVFGYQERYAEYRYKPSRITGLFNSDVSASLDVWHLAQDFTALPVLNESFIIENPPIDRVIAVPSEPHFLLDMWFDLKCARPMPVYSVPGFVDHF